MMKRILAVLAASVLMGIVAGVLAGRLPGIGVFAGAAVLGSIVVVLGRNQRDLGELERRLAQPADRMADDDTPLDRGGW
jgi:hypothetical protein